MFSTSRNPFSHYKNIWKQTKKSSKINQQKSEFSCVASFKFFLPSKNSILILLKPMITHQCHDHFLIIVDLENFESSWSLTTHRPRPRKWKWHQHSKFSTSKGMVISYNTLKSFIRTIQIILNQTTLFDNFEWIFLKTKSTHFILQTNHFTNRFFKTMISPLKMT